MSSNEADPPAPPTPEDAEDSNDDESPALQDEEDQALADEAASLDGYFSDAPLDSAPHLTLPDLRSDFDSAIVLTNLPRVPKSKLEKLTKVITKLVSRIGTLASSSDTGFGGVLLPCGDDDGSGKGCMTLGFALVEYVSPEEASKASEVLRGYKFDKNHSLGVYPYDRTVDLADLEENEFTEPDPEPFRERPDTSAWLEDPSQRDEFVLRHGKEMEVYWSDGKCDPVLDYGGERERDAGVAWCEYYASWSPHGSYLATLVPSKGVILWGGSSYEKLGRFPAPGVEFVLFSPQENYLLTNNNRRDDPNAVKIFSVQTGKLLRGFPLFPPKFLPENLNK